MAEKKIEDGGVQGKAKSNIIMELAPYTTLGIQLVLTIVLCTYIGWLIDDSYSTQPVFLIILTFFGVFAGMFSFIKTITKRKKINK